MKDIKIYPSDFESPEDFQRQIMADLGLGEPLANPPRIIQMRDALRAQEQISNRMLLLGWYRAALQFAEFPIPQGEVELSREDCEALVKRLEREIDSL